MFTALTVIGGANGLVNPASSQILARAAPPGVRVMVFSIKQTGVPLGAAICGLLLPALLLLMSWHLALLVIAAICLALISLLQPFRALYDSDRTPLEPLRFSAMFTPLREVWTDRRMRELAICSAVYSSVQLCLQQRHLPAGEYIRSGAGIRAIRLHNHPRRLQLDPA